MLASNLSAKRAGDIHAAKLSITFEPLLRMRKSLSLKPSKSSLKPEKIQNETALSGVFVYDEEVVPPGISNTALNCYANSVTSQYSIMIALSLLLKTS